MKEGETRAVCIFVCLCGVKKDAYKSCRSNRQIIYTGVKSSLLTRAALSVLLLFSGKWLHPQAGMCSHGWEQNNKNEQQAVFTVLL